jgi:hypothetical protein
VPLPHGKQIRVGYAVALSSLSAPRATSLSESSGRGRCNALAFRGHDPPRGPRDRTCRGYLVRENPWLQLQGRQHGSHRSRLRRVLLNVRYAPIATKVRSAAE